MVRVRIASIAVDTRGQHLVLLKPAHEAPGVGQVLPIWIGDQESTSILVAIGGAETPRPLTHDLMVTLLDTTGASVDRVAVTRLDEGTYYAELTVHTAAGQQVIDCRPSDAIALAARTAAPLFVADDVLDTAGIDDDFTDEQEDEDDAEKLEEFKRFLDEVDPEDFQS